MNAPRVDKRRKKEFAAELLARARAWIPDWELEPATRDFGMALLDIAARFDSEVAERLDRAGEKNRRGLLDWLGIQGEAARAARLPVVLRLGEQTPAPVAAAAPVKLRADTAAGPVVFETETDVTLVPGKLATLVAVDPATDAFFLPPPGIDNVEPPPVLPDIWRTKTFAAGGAARLQLDPELGLAPDMLVQVNGLQYRIAEVDKDLVTLDPPLGADAGVDANTVVTRVTAFTPFEPAARNRQRHALYIGDEQLLDIKAEATIAVDGLPGMPPGAFWEYWGKKGDAGSVGWQQLPPATGAAGGALTLAKPAGALEPYAVGGVESRWIRAVLDNHRGNAIAFDRLQLRINPVAAPNAFPACESGVSPEIEGVANNTPQVLNGVFFPFGREPRLYDTFYLGCAEAFSKKNAAVTVCFDLADPTMTSVTAVPATTGAAAVLAAPGQDGYLHLLKLARDGQVTPLRPPVQPPSPKDGGTRPGEAAVQLDRQVKDEDGPPARPAAWATGADFWVAVAAQSQVWVWHEGPPGEKQEPNAASGWISFGKVDQDFDKPGPITDLVVSGDSLYALREHRLFRRQRVSEGQWSEVTLVFDPPLPATARGLAALAAVGAADQIENAAVAALPPLCALADDGTAYMVWLAEGRCEKLPGMSGLNRRVRPAAFIRQLEDKKIQLGVSAVARLGDGNGELVSFLSLPVEASALPTTWKNGGAAPPRYDLGAPVVGRDLAGATFEGEFTLLAATERALMAVTPFSKQPPDAVIQLPLPAELGIAGGGPALAGQSHIVVPGTRSDLLVGLVDRLGLVGATLEPDAFEDVLEVDKAADLKEDDIFAFVLAGGTAVELVALQADPAAQGGKSIYRFQSPLTKAQPATDSWIYKLADVREGIRESVHDPRRQMSIDDPSVGTQNYLLVDTPNRKSARKTAYKVTRLEPDPDDSTRRIATFSKALPAGEGPLKFRSPVFGDEKVRTALTLNAQASAQWTDALIKQYPIHFSGLDPKEQRATEIGPVADRRRLLLAQRWETLPGDAVDAYIEVAKVEWERRLGETADNPLLSWEYWNGSGWWKLELESDATANFQRRGDLRLTVPADLQASEWAGKNNFWIRARLVGGDYGREKVTSVTTPLANEPQKQEQEVRRDPSNIHAPAVLNLALRYSLPATTPASILTLDNGTTRDQSAANRTGGAIVEAFMPLREMLARLGATAPPASRGGGSRCCPETSGGPEVPAVDASSGRAIYLGFDGRLQGEGVNILLLPSEEHNFDDFAPARVDVLRGTRFEPVVAADATRALGEAGILSIALASAPAPAELFGRTLAWLRIRPREGAAEQDWKPALRGAYLNAVWAQAAETQELEMLGSSQGAPFQQVLLARPPLLRDTLELRVREPLGDEERSALLAESPGKVLSAVPSQPGDWVLWKRVVDPADEDARARVYGLDEASGAVWFGDGVHGAIPPIGRDAIMAFRYRRTEAALEAGAPVPANLVGAGSNLSIVTPVRGAEAAFAADQAAGGSPPADTARVLRMAPAQLRQRGAAVTAGDLEEMALSLVPQAAQARCLRHGPAVQLVLVMQGADPRPSSALKRQLRRMLLGAAAPALAAPGAFAIVGPRPVPFYVRVPLATATLDNSAGLAASAKRAIAALFDSAAGGRDGQGWPLAARPSETDIAACLLDLPYVDGIGQVELTEHDAAGIPKPLRAALAATELAQLAADGIELQFMLPQEAR